MLIERCSFLLATLISSTVAFAAAAPAPVLDLSKLPAPSTRTGLTYAADIRPILEASCFSCHTDGQRPARGGLNMGTLAGIKSGGDSGDVIVSGKSTQSLLVIAASRIDPDTAMPPPPPRRGGTPMAMVPANLATQILTQADKDADQKISRDELRALADIWFDRMDTNKSGQIDHQRLVNGLLAAIPAAPPPPGPPTAPPVRGATSGPGARPGTPARPGQPAPAPANRGQPPGPSAPEGPEPVPLTAEQVGLLRAWIDQGAK